MVGYQVLKNLTDKHNKTRRNEYLMYKDFQIKKDLEYYIQNLKKGDFLFFKNGQGYIVKNHAKGSNLVTLDNNQRIDLKALYDDLLTVVNVREANGNFSPIFTMFAVARTVECLTLECSYHAYIDVILAVLKGDKTHYISKYARRFPVYGVFPYLTEDDLEMWLTGAEVYGSIKSKFSKNMRRYYVSRKDFRPWSRKFVRYVCYGSNMCEERFWCYITGEANKKLGIKEGQRCKDQSAYVAKIQIRIPYEMYFGNSSSSWDDGGVCFLNPTKVKDSKKYSFATAYLVSEDQYRHIWYREGKSREWYGKEIELDPLIATIAPFPTKTFTSEIIHEYNQPCKRYLNVVKKGLIEWGLTNKQATRYLFCKTNKIDK